MMSEDGKMPRHGSKTDVYSLGLVFVEMTAVLCDKSITEMRNSLFEGAQHIRQYHRVIDKIPEYLGQQCDEAWDRCLKQMLDSNRQSRPSAQGVMAVLEKNLGLGLLKATSKSSCTCYGIQQKSGTKKTGRQSLVTVHNLPSAKQGPTTIPAVSALEQTLVVGDHKIVISQKGGILRRPDGEAILTVKPSKKSMNSTKEPVMLSPINELTKDNQKTPRLNEDHSSKEPDDEFVWIHGGQVAVESLADVSQTAQLDDEKINAKDANDDKDPASNNIDVVMQQTDVSREKAIKALEEHDNDVIDAIMSFWAK